METQKTEPEVTDDEVSNGFAKDSASLASSGPENGWLVASVILCLVVFSVAIFSWWRAGESSSEAAVQLGLILDLNQATAEQLQALPDVGPQLAKRIVRHRDSHGPFECVDDLEQVRGVGPITLDELRTFLEVGGEIKVGGESESDIESRSISPVAASRKSRLSPTTPAGDSTAP